jgi:hypothetical protein
VIDGVPGVTPRGCPHADADADTEPTPPDDATERIVAALESEPRSGWEHTDGSAQLRVGRMRSVRRFCGSTSPGSET